ncbi:MAG TPA: 4'-phosphopantetheinyl transferase superfamily protein [Terriglobales bacterium]|nr:4'-phosphopantetheinyl transferase superfamily protein [Terriglobales bacterium]
MIVGLGIDFLEVHPFERELARAPWLPQDGVFTRREIRRCSRGPRPHQRYATCFAAKEATLKALCLVPRDLGQFREVEMARGPNHEDIIVLHRRLKQESRRLGVRRIRLATASTRSHSAAMVILEA